jgi:hypothetical protein
LQHEINVPIASIGQLMPPVVARASRALAIFPALRRVSAIWVPVKTGAGGWITRIHCAMVTVFAAWRCWPARRRAEILDFVKA